MSYVLNKLIIQYYSLQKTDSILFKATWGKNYFTFMQILLGYKVYHDINLLQVIIKSIVVLITKANHPHYKV